MEGNNDLTLNVVSHQPGNVVTLDVVRDGKPMTVKVTLGQRPNGVDWDKNGDKGDKDNTPGDDNTADAATPVRGMNVEALTPELAQQVGVPSGTHGVVVTAVDADSPAADAVGRGTVITAVDRHQVATVGEFKRLMNEAKDKAVLLTVNNGGRSGFIVVQPK